MSKCLARAPDLTIEEASALRQPAGHNDPRDVCVLVKAWMASGEFLQAPELVLPMGRDRDVPVLPTGHFCINCQYVVSLSYSANAKY